MQIQTLTASPYRLPFKQPWVDHHGRHTERRGWIIRIESDTLVGLGECAPFPSAGTETHPQAEACLNKHLQDYRGLDAEELLQRLDQSKHIYPAVQCGIETALIDLVRQRAELSFSQWLNPDAADRVLVNANLGVLSPDTAQKLKEAEGYNVIKLKVGVADLDSDIQRLRSLCRQLPKNISLRLDANQAWNTDDALRMLDACESLPIESIEEPLQNPTIGLLQTLQRTTPISIAADESLTQLPPEAFLQETIVKRLVLKPMAQYGPRYSLKLARKAHEGGIEAVITTTIDSAIGVWMATHLAAALPRKTDSLAHGLATSHWLKKDAVEPPSVVGGRILLGRAC